MALLLDFNVCQSDNCGTLNVTDVTGAYNVVSNPTGWGSPNIAYNDAGIEVTISITDSADVTTDYIVTGEVLDNAGGTIFLPISIEIPDGAFTVTYTVSTTAASNSVTRKYFSYCTVRCCVFKKMRAAVDKANCNCEKDLNYELFLWGIYKSMMFAAAGCNYDDAALYLEELQLACATGDCGCD